jgi:hypothetical protein
MVPVHSQRSGHGKQLVAYAEAHLDVPALVATALDVLES